MKKKEEFLMDDYLFGKGELINFNDCKSYDEFISNLNQIFTSNPNFWGYEDMLADFQGNVYPILKAIRNNEVEVYRHEFDHIAEILIPENVSNDLMDYCWRISKARTNPALPLLYYHAVLYLDTLGFSLHLSDLTTKIFYLKRNYYPSLIKKLKKVCESRYNSVSHFFHDKSNFADLDVHIPCECGSVSGYRLSSMVDEYYFPNFTSDYLIFPFHDYGNKGVFYHFKKKVLPME